jgi:nucleotide-binding universal stress UspA family protein
MTKKLIRKILVAVDGSSGSEKAAMHAINLAEEASAELALVHVIEDIKMGGVIGARAKYGDVKLVEGYNRVRKETAMKWLSRLEEKATNEKVKASSDVLYDTGRSVTGMIVEHAQKKNVDLIVVGTRGHSRFKQLLVGSVASGVTNHAHCPVLIVK